MNDTNPISVVVIDDDPAVHSSLVAFLEDEGFSVDFAGDGEKGLELIETKRPDVAIVDMRLPGISGEKVIKKASARYPTMRFFVFTGSSDFELNETLRACGVRDEQVFRKPVFDMMKLSEAIRLARS